MQLEIDSINIDITRIFMHNSKAFEMQRILLKKNIEKLSLNMLIVSRRLRQSVLKDKFQVCRDNYRPGTRGESQEAEEEGKRRAVGGNLHLSLATCVWNQALTNGFGIFLSTKQLIYTSRTVLSA